MSLSPESAEIILRFLAALPGGDRLKEVFSFPDAEFIGYLEEKLILEYLDTISCVGDHEKGIEIIIRELSGDYEDEDEDEEDLNGDEEVP